MLQTFAEKVDNFYNSLAYKLLMQKENKHFEIDYCIYRYNKSTYTEEQTKAEILLSIAALN